MRSIIRPPENGPPAGKRPIPLELVAPGFAAERPFDFRPCHVPMPIHVPVGHGVGNPLVAKLAHQPIEDSGGVTVFDCVDEASFDCAIPQIVDAGGLASNVAYPPNNRSSMPHPLGLTRNGDPAWHVRSTQLTGVERRYRRRCRPGSFESTGDRRAAEHRVTTRRLYERGGQRG